MGIVGSSAVILYSSRIFTSKYYLVGNHISELTVLKRVWIGFLKLQLSFKVSATSQRSVNCVDRAVLNIECHTTGQNKRNNSGQSQRT